MLHNETNYDEESMDFGDPSKIIGWKVLASGGLPLGMMICFFIVVAIRHFNRPPPPPTPPPQEKEVPVVKHRESIVAYFEESGNQMAIAHDNLADNNYKQDDIEEGYTGRLLVLPGTPPDPQKEDQDAADDSKPGEELSNSTRHVKDCCAVCLDPYQEQETVVWSHNKDCPHVFHRECFVDYLMTHRGDGSPCPICRQEFCSETVFATPANSITLSPGNTEEHETGNES